MNEMFDMTPERAIELDAEARWILRLNDRGGYTVPTAGLYPYQWNWDSAFAAYGFAAFEPIFCRDVFIEQVFIN